MSVEINSCKHNSSKNLRSCFSGCTIPYDPHYQIHLNHFSVMPQVKNRRLIRFADPKFYLIIDTTGIGWCHERDKFNWGMTESYLFENCIQWRPNMTQYNQIATSFGSNWYALLLRLHSLYWSSPEMIRNLKIFSLWFLDCFSEISRVLRGLIVYDFERIANFFLLT